MRVFKNKPLLLGITVCLLLLLVVCCVLGIFASWGTKENLQSSVQVSLLLQGDEADIYESPVTLTSKGVYELSTIGTKDTDGNYVGNDVGVGKKPEPSRTNFYDYVMPGVNIPKDPKVFITKKSGSPAYLYLEVYEHNFPEYFTEDGFQEVGVDADENTTSIKPVYYDLEDYWKPVYTAEGKQALGVNGGALYVYYNENDYFKTNKYNQNFTIEIGVGSEKETISQGATYLSSYIMKDESTGFDKIDKQQYYGTNEVKTVDGKPVDCPYFNILKEDTVYVSEKYIHPEYYSKLYSGLAEITGTVTKEGHDFGLYFFSYMASAKVDGAYASPFDAYTKAGFMEEEAYLMYTYESTDKSESVPQERIVYVWDDHLYTKSQGKIFDKGIHDAVKDYFGDGKPYKIVLMESLKVESDINVSTGSNFVLDMNGKTLAATEGITEAVLRFVVSKIAVEITGDGTFDMGTIDRRAISVAGNAKLIIRNGNFIREYDETRTGQEAFYAPLINKGSSGSYIYIYDGYFDNGYWSLEDTIADFFNSKNPQNLLPLYDTKTGKGWLMHEDGSYLTIDPKGDIYKIETDENGMMKWTQLENKYGLVYAWPKGRGDYIYKDDSGYYKLVYFNGTNYTAIDSKNVNNTVEESKLERLYLESTEDGNWTYTLNGKVTNVYKIYPERVKLITQKLDNPDAYVRVLDENGNYVVDENGKYKLEKLESYDKTYGPCPYGIATALGSGGVVGANEHFLVYGGTFVVQNPLWGDEVGMQQHYAESQMICPEEYNPQRLLNPWYLLWTADIDNSFLHGQIVWQDEGIIDEYNIAESSMLRTYVDENGENKSFYVPVYTVNYSGEIPD